MTDQQERVALLPCPFCGGEAKFTYHNFSWNNVECADWKCPSRSGGRSSKEQAAELWNTRAAMPAPTVQEAAKVLLGWSGDYMPTAARVPAVKGYLEVTGTTVRPAAISAAWLAALRALAEQEGE